MSTENPETVEDSVPHRLDLREESLNKTILQLAVPAIMENLMYSAVFIMDTFIVGWLKDPNALAGTLLSGTLLMFGMAPFQALSVATASLVSRSWGEQDYEKARKYASQTLSIVFFTSILLLIIGWPLANKLIAWMGGSPEVAKEGGMYMRIILLSSPIGIPMFISNGIIRATGNTKTPMYITLTMNVIHIILSISLAYGYGPFAPMGLKGVAWGSMLAETIGGTMSLFVLFRGFSAIHIKMGKLYEWKRAILSQVFFLSLPVMLERSLNSGAHVLFMTIVAKLGTITLAAHNLALRIEALSFMPAFGISVAISTVVGQALGAKLPHIADMAVRRALYWATIFTVGLGILFVVFSHQIVSSFKATPDILVFASLAVKISALELPFLAFVMIISGALRGAGDTKSPLYVMLICIPIFRFGVLYFIAIHLGWGIGGIWLATAMDWACRFLGLWWIFKGGVWKKIHEKQAKIKYN